ncbi:MAG: alpha/beta fold hydrolase [Haloarculaceae archaeon]
MTAVRNDDDLGRAHNGDVSLAYERIGPREAPTVVFVEGLGYGRWMWRWQRSALAEYERIVWDNRGTGDSDVPEGPYSIREMADDLEAVLADAGVERAHVVGASMGGMIALQYALDHDRAVSLTLLSTTPGGPDTVPIPEETRDRIFGLPDDIDEREAIRRKMAPALSAGFDDWHSDLYEQIVDWRLESDAPERAREWQAAAVAAFDVSDRLEEVTLPALVVHGTDDRVVPVENGRLLADRLPNAEFLELGGGPHLVFIEQAEAVNDRLREFLDGLRA